MAELKNSMGVTFDHISSVRVSGKETQFKYRPWGECREIFKRHESTLDVHLSQ